MCPFLFISKTDGLDSSHSLVIDLGDPIADQEPAQVSGQVPAVSGLADQASGPRSVAVEDVPTTPAQQTIEPTLQQPAPIVDVSVVFRGSSRLARPLQAREVVGLIRLGEPFPSVFLEEGYRGRCLVF